MPFWLLVLAAAAAIVSLLSIRRGSRRPEPPRSETAGTGAVRTIADELRASEQRYRSLIEATTSIVAVTDEGGRFIQPQPEWEAYTGQHWEVHRDLGWIDAFHEDDRDALGDAFLAGPHPDTVYENRLRLWHAATAAYRYVVVRGAAVVDDDGEIREWVGTVTDAHERTLADLRRAGAAQLRSAVLGSLQDGLFVADARGRVIEVNEAWTRITGYSREEALTARPPYPWWPDVDYHPQAWHGLNALLDDVRGRNDPVEAEVAYVHRDGHLVPTITSVALVRDGDEVELVIGSVKDITDRKAAEEALRSERDFREGIVAALQEGMLVCTPAGAVLDVNDAWTRITGFTRDQILSAEPPYAWWPDDEELHARLRSDLEAATRGEPTTDTEVTIRRADAEQRLVVVNRHAMHDPTTGEFVAVVSTFRDITRRAAAEARLRAFAALTARLASCNDVAGVAEATLAELMAPIRCDVGAVAIVDNEAGVFGVVSEVGMGPQALSRWTRVSLDHPGPMSAAAETQTTVVVRDRAQLERRFPAIADGAAERGIESFVAMPLVRAAETIGLLFLGFHSRRDLSSSDMDLLSGATPIVAQALERARLFEFQQSVATTLQHAMLSEPPLGTSQFAVATRYQPAVSNLEVGGDWFDVFSLTDRHIGVAAGDIVGRGLAAAAVMGQLRSALGALAHTTPRAGDAISRLDRFARSIPGARATTICYGIVDIAARTFRFATAGHLPPLLIAADGTCEFLDGARSWPLGVGPPGAERPEAVVTLPPGSTLLLYTDGLIERRGRRLEAGLEQLAREAVRHAGLPVEMMCDELLATLVRDQPADDIALVALRLVTEATPAFTCRVPAAAAELAVIRQQLRAWLERRALPVALRDDVVLAVGEACTNAIEHAYASGIPNTVVVEAHCDRDDLVLTVRDRGSWRPRAPDPRRNRGLQLMHTIMDDVSVSAVPDGGTRVRMRRKLGSA